MDEARERRAPFSFDGAQIPIGTILTSTLDENSTCEVVGNKTVRFEGEETSLSAAALVIAHRQGYTWKTIAGPQYWRIGDLTLDEIREGRDAESSSET